MRIYYQKILLDFCDDHSDLRGAAGRWLSQVKLADWASHQDLKRALPSPSLIDTRRVVFNIKGNKYRLLANMYYSRGVVTIIRVGTHAEYSKWKL